MYPSTSIISRISAASPASGSSVRPHETPTDMLSEKSLSVSNGSMHRFLLDVNALTARLTSPAISSSNRLMFDLPSSVDTTVRFACVLLFHGELPSGGGTTSEDMLRMFIETPREAEPSAWRTKIRSAMSWLFTTTRSSLPSRSAKMGSFCAVAILRNCSHGR